MYIPNLPKEEIEPTEIIGGCIAIFENAWKNPLETIEEIEEITSDPATGITFTKAQTYEDGLNGNKRTNLDLNLTYNAQKNEVIRKINNEFFNISFAAMNYYYRKFNSEGIFRYTESFNLLKYQTGQEYKAHHDGDTVLGRAYSPILYLNDEYSGGELEFINFNITIKPKAGMLVIFPSNYPYSHIAHPVKTGTKYAIVTWLHDREN
jgi:predicted 2-oxoglutarate/Fe(II)-dependent dioxygenase YbiX